jgi:hypothetical protein
MDRSCFTKFSLNVILKYFIWELLPAGAVDKSKLSIFLTSWVDKSSSLCMYTMDQTRIWSIPHLKAGCWYIDCGKVYCPIQEEDVRKACETASSKDAITGTDNAQEQEDEVEVDINLLPKKEKNKVLKHRDKAKDKAEKEALKAKDKVEREAKKGERASKSKAMAAPSFFLLLIEASTAMSSQNPLKWDAFVAQLSMSRLQQITSLALMDSIGKLYMFKSSSSLDPFYPLMHILCSTRLSPRNGWI